MCKKGILLENRVKGALVRRKVGYVLSLKKHLSRIGSLKSSENPQGGGLAAA